MVWATMPEPKIPIFMFEPPVFAASSEKMLECIQIGIVDENEYTDLYTFVNWLIVQ